MDSKDEGPRPGRGLRFRLGLRSLLLLVLAIGSGLGWVVLGAREQRDLVAHIRSIGGAVGYEGERNRIFADQVVAHRLWPAWLVRRLGPDYFHGVTNVNLLGADRDKVDGDLLARICRLRPLKTLVLCESNKVADGDLGNLRRLPNLEELWLRGPKIQGSALKYINKFRKLKTLYIIGIHLADEDLAHLSGLSSLRELALIGGEAITDEGLAHLATLTGLESLKIEKASLSGIGLVHLGCLPNLCSLAIFVSPIVTLQPLGRMRSIKELALAWTMLSDDALAPVAGLENLERLDLGFNRLTDGCMVHLAHLDKLSDLTLAMTGITDAGLPHLYGLHRLKHFVCIGSPVTEEGRTSLREKIPSIEIE